MKNWKKLNKNIEKVYKTCYINNVQMIYTFLVLKALEYFYKY